DARAEAAARGHRALEGADDGGADGDDPAAAGLGGRDRGDRRLRDRVALGEREEAIHRRIAGRREAGGVGEAGEADARAPEAAEGPPVERSAGGGHLGRPGPPGEGALHRPEGERRAVIAVLHRRAAAVEAGPERLALAIEGEG